MFQKGIQPGYSPKTIFLQKCPTAFCKKETFYLDSGNCISGYYIYLQKNLEKENKHFVASESARDAWEKADAKWERLNNN